MSTIDQRKRKPRGRYRPPAKPSPEQIRRGNAFLKPTPTGATLADIWPLAPTEKDREAE